MDPATVVQTTNSWLLSKWYVPGILLDAVRKISIFGREIYSIRGHFDGTHAKPFQNQRMLKMEDILENFWLNPSIT